MQSAQDKVTSGLIIEIVEQLELGETEETIRDRVCALGISRQRAWEMLWRARELRERTTATLRDLKGGQVAARVNIALTTVALVAALFFVLGMLGAATVKASDGELRHGFRVFKTLLFFGIGAFFVYAKVIGPRTRLLERLREMEAVHFTSQELHRQYVSTFGSEPKRMFTI